MMSRFVVGESSILRRGSAKLHLQLVHLVVKSIAPRQLAHTHALSLSTYPIIATYAHILSIQQKPHLLIHNARHSPLPHLRRAALVDRRPRCRLRRPQCLRLCHGLFKPARTIDSAVHDVALARELFGKLVLVIVEERGVWHDDERDGEAETVEDCAGAWDWFSGLGEEVVRGDEVVV